MLPRDEILGILDDSEWTSINVILLLARKFVTPERAVRSFFSSDGHQRGRERRKKMSEEIQVTRGIQKYVEQRMWDLMRSGLVEKRGYGNDKEYKIL